MTMLDIIAVDDEPLALKYFLDRAEELPEVASARGFTSPEEAIEYMRENEADAAFLDIELCGMNGIELARRLKDLRPGISVIFVTGYSEYAVDAFRVHASGYLLKPVSGEAISAELRTLGAARRREPRSARLRVQTFGNFEVFSGGAPLKFSRSRTKEMLAYLIDRRGAAATTGELISILWEDRENDRTTGSMLRTVAADLTSALRAAGAQDVLIKTRNSYAVDVDKLDCDYYDFLRGDAYAVNAYAGEYMSNYSWAELTTGFLTRLKM